MSIKLSMLSIAATSLVAAGVTASISNDAEAGKKEKCYGIVKAGANDCGTSTHSCAGAAEVDNHPEEWVFVPKGLCERIAGASLKPKT